MRSGREAPIRAARFVVTGRVQGVGFRYSACRVAKGFGVRGWVRNRADGSVEIVAEGNPRALDRLALWLKRGPTGAYVSELISEPLEYTGQYRSFAVRY